MLINSSDHSAKKNIGIMRSFETWKIRLWCNLIKKIFLVQSRQTIFDDIEKNNTVKIEYNIIKQSGDACYHYYFV